MPRHARLVIPGIPLHIIQRGNNKSCCIADEKEKRLYHALLSELAPRHGCAIHAYVLMDNHVHLLATPSGSRSAALLMKNVGQRYVQYVNRHRARSGTLWEGRFRSSIVDSDRYLLTCHRYIELNPVRAGMVGQVQEYPWSSHRCNAQGAEDALITPHSNYSRLGSDAQSRLAAYRGLGWLEMSASDLAAIRAAANSGFVLGGPAFVERIERELGRPAARRKRGPVKRKREGNGVLFLPVE